MARLYYSVGDYMSLSLLQRARLTQLEMEMDSDIRMLEDYFADHAPDPPGDETGKGGPVDGSNLKEDKYTIKQIDEDGVLYRIYIGGCSIGIDMSGMRQIGYYFREGTTVPALLGLENAIIGEGDIFHRDITDHSDNVNGIFSWNVALLDDKDGNFSQMSIEGAGNIFRHLLISASLTATFGYDRAKEIGDTYERSESHRGNLSTDMIVDLINNYYGRQYAMIHKLDMKTITASNESTASFLNSLAVYTLSNLDSYKNNSNYASIISGKTLLFSASSYGVNLYRTKMNQIMYENFKKFLENKPSTQNQ